MDEKDKENLSIKVTYKEGVGYIYTRTGNFIEYYKKRFPMAAEGLRNSLRNAKCYCVPNKDIINEISK